MYRQDVDIVNFFRTFLELKEITAGITNEIKKKQVTPVAVERETMK